MLQETTYSWLEIQQEEWRGGRKDQGNNDQVVLEGTEIEKLAQFLKLWIGRHNKHFQKCVFQDVPIPTTSIHYFRIFYSMLIIIDGIRTADLWCRNGSLCRLIHHHVKKFDMLQSIIGIGSVWFSVQSFINQTSTVWSCDGFEDLLLKATLLKKNAVPKKLDHIMIYCYTNRT